MSDGFAPQFYPQRQRTTAWETLPGGFLLRAPQLADGPAMWRLVRRSTLDDNSPYAYLMLARYHAETCLVAQRGEELSGFVTAFVPPGQPDTLFVWQVGVDPAARGHGLATRMIRSLLSQPAARAVRYLEATVTPSNEASLALFRGLAEKLGTRCRESECFAQHVFPDTGHEPEWLLRIGPFGGADAAESISDPE